MKRKSRPFAKTNYEIPFNELLLLALVNHITKQCLLQMQMHMQKITFHYTQSVSASNDFVYIRICLRTQCFLLMQVCNLTSIQVVSNIFHCEVYVCT